MTMVDLDLSGRTALVCGASSGIGRAAALALAGCGAHVVALARREAALVDLVDDIAQAGGAASHRVVDMDDTEAVASLAQGLDAQILVHNSGGPKGGRLLDDDPGKLLSAFRRHVLSAQVLVQGLLPAMTEAGFGRIVCVTSTSLREPIPNLGTSNTIRAAMGGWAKTLSRELPPGVTINTVMPGFTDTDRLTSLMQGRAAREGTSAEAVREAFIAQVPEGRLAEPSETGATIAFLCSPAAAYIRGQAIAVDGGRLRST